MRFDFAYRVRRLQFVLRRVNRLILLAAQMGEPNVESERRALNRLLQSVMPDIPQWPAAWSPESFRDFYDQLHTIRDHVNCALQILRLGIQNLHASSISSIGCERPPVLGQSQCVVRSHPQTADLHTRSFTRFSAPSQFQQPREVEFAFDEEMVLARAATVLREPAVANGLNELDETLNTALHRLFDDAIAEVGHAFQIKLRILKLSNSPQTAAISLAITGSIL